VVDGRIINDIRDPVLVESIKKNAPVLRKRRSIRQLIRIARQAIGTYNIRRNRESCPSDGSGGIPVDPED
jgi:hypothetical protein